MKFGLGQAVRRKEDARILTGAGRHVAVRDALSAAGAQNMPPLTQLAIWSALRSIGASR
jgi:hypothetical protein